MPSLTRRRDPDADQETWQVYFRDVRVGTVSERAAADPFTSGLRRCLHDAVSLR